MSRSSAPARLAVAAAALLLAACSADTTVAPAPAAPVAAFAADPVANRTVAAIRAATAKYHDVDVALADGYINSGECVASPLGGMGVHFVNMALMGAPAPNGDATFTPTRPEVLVYQPMQDGSYKLVAVEYIVWRAAWDAQRPGTAPSLLGEEFERSFGPAAHGLPDHYEMHLWTWEQNPNGLFAPWNPKVSCS